MGTLCTFMVAEVREMSSVLTTEQCSFTAILDCQGMLYHVQCARRVDQTGTGLVP